MTGGRSQSQERASIASRVWRHAWLLVALLALASPAFAEARRLEGRHASGAAWAIDVPGTWNGTLLLYSRGYSPALTPHPDTAPRGLRELLLARGYALAASGYSAAGWALEEAPPDQIGMLDTFAAEVGKPRRTIAWGSSMGGLVSLALVERYPGRFAAALPLCGSVSGSLDMLNTAFDAAFVFRTLLAPDSQIRLSAVDEDRANSARVQVVLDEAWRTPQGRARVVLAATLAQLPQWSDPESPEPAANDFEARAEQLRRAFVMGVFVPRTDQERRAGVGYSWNQGIDYTRQLERSGGREFVRHFYSLADLDLMRDLSTLAAAPRSAADAAAVDYMRANFVPTGRLDVPVLTLQSTGDGLTVPATHGSLRERVEAAGSAAMLGQVHVHAPGHCRFEPAEVLASLAALEDRLDSGQWHLSVDEMTRRGAAHGGGTRFTDYTPPALLRSEIPR